MSSTQSARSRLGFYRPCLPRQAAAMVFATLIAALTCLPDANAGGKRKSRKKAQVSSAEASSATVSSDRAASDRKVDKVADSKRGRDKRGRKKRLADRPLDEAVLRYLPEDCHAFATLDVAAILQSKFAKNVLANNPTNLEDILGSFAPLGLELDYVERITFCTPSLVGGDMSEYVAVLFCKQSPEKPSSFSSEGTKWTTERIGPTTLWVRGEDWAVCAVDDRVALAGPPDSIRKVLKRDAPAKLPEKLDHARRLTDPSAAFAVSFLADGELHLGAAMSMGIPGLADGVEAVNLEVELDADLAMQWALICRDDDSAHQISGMVSGLWTLVKMQGMQNQEPAVREMIRSVSFDVEGPVFRADMKVPRSLVQFHTKYAKLPAAAGCVPAVAQTPVGPPSTRLPNCPPTSCPPSPYGSQASLPAAPSANPYANNPAYANGYTVTTPSYTANVSGYAAQTTTPPSPYAASWSARPRPAAPVLTPLKLSDVVLLVEAGVDEEVIIRHVKKHHLSAPLTAQDLILLTGKKAATKVITTLQGIPAAPKPSQPKKTEAKTPAYQPATPPGVLSPAVSKY